MVPVHARQMPRMFRFREGQLYLLTVVPTTARFHLNRIS